MRRIGGPHQRVSFRLFARLLWLGMLLLACAYLLLLEVSVRRDVLLPTVYDAVPGVSGDTQFALAPMDQSDALHLYVHQEGRPFTMQQDILLSRLAYLETPPGFSGGTVADLCNAVEAVLADPQADVEAALGRDRKEAESLLAALRADAPLLEMQVLKFFSYPSGLAGCALDRGGEPVLAFRGTDDLRDALDNFLLLPFNLSVQYGDVRRLLAGFPEAERIWLVGHSKGGHNAIYAASVDARCRAVGFNAPGFGIFLRWSQLRGLDRGVNYVLNGDVSGFLLFHLERRVVLDSSALPVEGANLFTAWHRLDSFFPLDALHTSRQIRLLSVATEWTTQILWLVLVFPALYKLLLLGARLMSAPFRLLLRRQARARA